MGPQTYSLVLAAGGGQRFGMPKAMFRLGGDRLVDVAVRTARDGGCDDVLVVLGAYVGEVPFAEVIYNPKWRSGLASSLSAGLTRLASMESVDRVIITLVDEPYIAAADIQQLVTSTSRLAAIRYGDEWSHPVLVHRSHWKALLQTLGGDRGARRYLMEHLDELTCYPAGNLAGLEDIDFQPGTSLPGATGPRVDRAVQRGQ